MHKNNWNYLKWRLPDTCRGRILGTYKVEACDYIGFIPSPSKKYEIFKLSTENEKEINIFCKYSTDYEMRMHIRIWNIASREIYSAKVPKCFGFWKNKLFMEYIACSVTLEQFLWSDFALEELKTILEQLGCFMAILHYNGIRHKDLNLNNILYSMKTGFAYVIDFETSEENPQNTNSEFERELLTLKRNLAKKVRHEDTVDALSRSYDLKRLTLN